MSSVITAPFHNSVAEDVLSEIQANTSRYYYYFGNTVPAPEVSETPLDSPQYIARTKSNMITLMQISSNDVSFVLLRNNWASGTRYNKYESAHEGIPTNFYVITDEYNVYKCLDNSVAGALSTIKPTGSDVDPIITADGYKWKFMYNVPLALRNKFMTAAYIPVSTGLRNRFFSSGEIDSLVILANGVGYTQPTTSITVTGDGSGAALTPVITDGQLVGVTIDNPGIGYSYATVNVISSLVTVDEDKAIVIANMVNGNISSQQAIIENLTTPGTIDCISVVNGGTGFTGTPTVTITGDGSGCTATATVVNSVLTKINIVTPGSGYTFANVALGSVGGATGYEVSANVSPPLGHGRNAIKELYADTLMFYGNLSGALVNGFAITNDYRQFGVIKNIRSSSYDLGIVNQMQKGKFTIFCDESVDEINITDTIVNVGLSQTFTVTAKQVGGTKNALEVVPSGDYAPVVGTTYTKGGDTETVIVDAVQYQPLLGTRSASMCYTVTATYDSGVFVNDTVLTKDGKTFIIVATIPGKLMIQALDGGVISNGDILYFGVTPLTASTVLPPDADKNTGDLLTIDNRPSFFQSAEQSVSTRTVIRF